MNPADVVLAIVLVALATAPVVDALRRRGALARPEFYLLVTLYLYATGGYLTYLILPRLSPAQGYTFLLPAGDLAIHTSYLYSVCAVLAVYAGGRLYNPDEPERRHHPGGDRLLVAFALAGCVLALAANAYYFYTFGLFSGNFDRVEFIDEFDATGGAKLPYLEIFYASIAVLALNERWPTSPLLLTGLALLHLPVGNRRIVLAALIIVLAAKLLRGARFRKGFWAAVLAVVLVVGVVVGDIRGEGFSALEGFDLVRVFMALSEFSRPFVALVYYVENGYELLYGTSLFQAFVSIIPGSVLPFDKPVSLSRQFVETVGTLGVYYGRVSGYGFYPVAEALLNFGPVGIPALFLLFAPIVRWLSACALRSGYAFLVPVLCANMFAFGRNPFVGVFAMTLWTLAVGLAIHLAAGLTREVLARRPRLATRAKVGLER